MCQKGMTLIELMVVMVVASIIGIAVLNMFTLSNRTFMDQNKIIDVQRDGRLVIEYIARTLREAGLNPLNSSGCEGVKFRDDDPVMLIIDRDLDVDGACENNDKEVVGFTVRTELDGTKTLIRGFNIGFGNVRWHDMAKNITNFSFDYFDESGATITVDTPPWTNIHSIDITIAFKDEKFTGGDFTRTYKTRVELRNR